MTSSTSSDIEYDVQLKAIKPNKVVTVARFDDLGKARECVAGLATFGFQATLSYQETPQPAWGRFDAPYDR